MASTKYCRKCRMEIDRKATKCPYCGSSQGLSCSGMIGAFIFVIAAIFILSRFGGGSTPKTSSSSSSSGNFAAKSFVDDIKTTTETTDDKANDIKNILDEAGLTDYKSIEQTSSDDEFDYYKVVTSQNNFILTLNKDGGVDGLNIELRFNLPPLIEDGTIIHKYSEYIIKDSIKSTLRVECQLQIEKLLKSPKSAEFPTISGWSFTKDFETGYIYVSSYVDADNSFGASIRSDFTFGFNVNENDTYSIVYCFFDDVVVIDRR